MNISGPKCLGCGEPVGAVPKGSPCPKCGDTRRIVSAVGTAAGRGEASAQSAVKRGSSFWSCAHWLFALLLGVVAFSVTELPIDDWWAKIIVFFCFAGILAALIYESRTVHNLITRLQGTIEDRFR